jgi:hypothetical protein
VLVGNKNGYTEACLKVLPEHLLLRSKESQEKFVFQHHIRSADLDTRLLTSAVDESDFSYEEFRRFYLLRTPGKQNLRIEDNKNMYFKCSSFVRLNRKVAGFAEIKLKFAGHIRRNNGVCVCVCVCVRKETTWLLVKSYEQ